MIYRCRGDEAESRLERTVREAAELKQALEDAELNGYEEHELLSRVLREQSDEDADGVRTPKDKGEIRSDSLQNPSDPEATFRRKAGEEHKGYVGNVVETLNDDGLGIITTRLRNGIECRPSLLRRRLDVDNIPVFGYLASKCFFMVKTGASNLIAFFSYRRRQLMKCAIFA